VLRAVGGDRRLLRAHAANAGLLAARGEALFFLDDDDTYDGHFISAMVAAAAEHPDALVVYARSRLLRADGTQAALFGRPFNRALMHYGPLFHWHAALIRRAVIDRGCRFDEALDVCEDRDFLAQIAELSDFAFVPVIGSNYHADLGTSGTAERNRDVANTVRFDALLRAKFAGSGAYHTWRSTRLNMRAVRAYLDGDRAGSRALFETVLREYPDDPSALHGCARIELDGGALGQARVRVERALDINPEAAEFRLTYALILERLGRSDEARREARRAAGDPAQRPAADALLNRLGLRAAGEGIVAAGLGGPQAPSRLGPCPCGSGTRYKQCCGRAATHPPAAPADAAGPSIVPEPAAAAADRAASEARELFARGEAWRAKALVDAIAPADMASADLARVAGDICLALGSFEQAYAFLDRSARLARSARTGTRIYECCDRLWQARARAASNAKVLRLRERIESRSGPARARLPGPIHLLATFGTIGGSENQAASLYRMLSPHADVRLWSTDPPLLPHYAGLPITAIDPANTVFPTGGTLVLAGQYFDCGEWIEKAEFDRVVINVNLDESARLVHRLAELERAARVARVDFTLTSRLFRDFVGLPGAIEFSLPDVAHFAPAPGARRTGAHLVVGRHSRDDPTKHHPNDPALYRQLAARGHRVRLLGGTVLAPAFAGDSAASAATLLPTGGQDAREFLAGLDCFIYRKHPNFFETGGTVILEAMAMALPVVVFRDRVGAAELIDHSQDGFVVDTDAEALDCIDRLAPDAGLRAAIGAAARRKVVAVMEDQAARILAYYLDPPPR
jgi:tetratricopeptide (TPR) repeat protein